MPDRLFSVLLRHPWTVGGALYQVAIADDGGEHRSVLDEIVAAIRVVPPA